MFPWGFEDLSKGARLRRELGAFLDTIKAMRLGGVGVGLALLFAQAAALKLSPISVARAETHALPPVAHVDLHAHPSRPAVAPILKALVPHWVEQAGAFRCEELSGGLTNVVIRAKPQPGSECESLLIRIFGENTERVLDRGMELQTLQTLADSNMTAVFGTFNNGRVERYAPGRVLDVEEMREPQLAGKIARALARLHAVDVPGHTREPSLWPMLDRWLDLALADNSALPLGLDEAKVRRAIADLRSRIEELDPSVGFAHNDASALNLIYDESDSRLTLIDFEYARYNYRAFDLANHLFEYAGSGPIRRDLLPNEDEQMAFLSEYVRATASGSEDGHHHGQKKVRALYEELQAFYTASHLFWGLWALVRSAEPGAVDEFDYLAYAEERLEMAFAP